MSLDPTTTRPSASRRRVVGAAIWTAPAVAAVSAAPAFAASPCDTSATVTLNWSSTNYVRSINTATAATGQASVTPAGQTLLVINFSEATTGNYHFGGASISPNGNLTNSTVFGTAGSTGLDLIQYRIASAAATPPAQLTITFARPVTNLSFTLKDISNPSNAYKDTVYFTPAPTSFANRGSQLQGVGSSTDPFTTNAIYTYPGVESPLQAVTPTFAGPLLTLVLNYYDTSTSTTHSDQGLRIGNMTFTAKPDGCP